MKPIGQDRLRTLSALRREIGCGTRLCQRELDALEHEWAACVDPNDGDTCERFALSDEAGRVLGPTAPRWLFHMLGLCHRASHIGLSTPEGFVILQRRSFDRTDWPGAWDMAAAGHISSYPGLPEPSFLDGALRELGEEIGLGAGDVAGLTVEGRLVEIGEPYFAVDDNDDRNPPFHNAESRQLYGATLTAEGLARLRPCPEELSGILICRQSDAWRILDREPVASGVRYSLPRFLDWLARNRGAM